MDAHDFSAISFALGFQHFSTPGTSTGKIRHGSNADIRSLLAIKRDRNVIAPPKVVPADFFDQLADVLKDAKPLPGEEAPYAQALSLVAALQKDSALKAAAIDEATKTEHALSGHSFRQQSYGPLLGISTYRRGRCVNRLRSKSRTDIKTPARSSAGSIGATGQVFLPGRFHHREQRASFNRRQRSRLGPLP